MKIFVAVFLGMIMFIGAGGCALPRAGVMYAAARRECPVIPGGSVAKVSVRPWAPGSEGEPAGEIRVLTEEGLTETSQWYRDELKRRGWVFQTRGETAQTALDEAETMVEGGITWNLVRSTCLVGNIPLVQEQFWIHFRRRADDAGADEGTMVEMEISGDYVWDWPGKLGAACFAGVGYIVAEFHSGIGFIIYRTGVYVF